MSASKSSIDYSNPAYIEAYKAGTRLAENKEPKPITRNTVADAGYNDAYYDVWSRRQLSVAMASVFREDTRGKTVTNAMAL